MRMGPFGSHAGAAAPWGWRGASRGASPPMHSSSSGSYGDSPRHEGSFWAPYPGQRICKGQKADQRVSQKRNGWRKERVCLWLCHWDLRVVSNLDSQLGLLCWLPEPAFPSKSSWKGEGKWLCERSAKVRKGWENGKEEIGESERKQESMSICRTRGRKLTWKHQVSVLT